MYGDILKENFEANYPDGTFRYKPFFANRVFGEWPKIDEFFDKIWILKVDVVRVSRVMRFARRDDQLMPV